MEMIHPIFLVEAGITYVFDAPEEPKLCVAISNIAKSQINLCALTGCPCLIKKQEYNEALTLAKKNKILLADQEKGKELIRRKYSIDYEMNKETHIMDGVYPIPGLRIELRKESMISRNGDRYNTFKKGGETLAYILPFEDEKEKVQEFKRGDKIKIHTGFPCDIGTFIGYEGGKIIWTSDIGGMYKSPPDIYKITLLEKESVSSLVEVEQESQEAIIDFAVWYSGMEKPKVESAYRRYCNEVLTRKP